MAVTDATHCNQRCLSFLSRSLAICLLTHLNNSERHICRRMRHQRRPRREDSGLDTHYLGIRGCGEFRVELFVDARQHWATRSNSSELEGG